jgi:hypothetical protein
MTYIGPATVLLGERSLTVPVRLSSRFEPVEGRHRWGGRTSAAELTEAFRAGARDVTVRIGDGPSRPARLSDPDPWGGVRLTGAGSPPWDGDAGQWHGREN